MNAPETFHTDTHYLADTHEVINVSRELADYNMYAQDAALLEAVRREGAAWAHDDLSGLRRAHRLGRLPGAGRAGQPLRPGARHARPLRQPHRPGEVPPGLSHADEDGDRARAALVALDRPEARRARGPRRRQLPARAGRRRPRLPGHHDFRGGAVAAPAPRRWRSCGSRRSPRASTTRATCPLPTSRASRSAWR